MAKKKRKRHNRARAAPTPPSTQGAAPHPGANPPPRQATGTGIGQKVLHTARKVVKAGAGEVKNTVVDGAKGTGRYITQKAAQTIHAKVSEAEQDNAALETAHKAERIGEHLARSGLRKGKKMVRDRLKNFRWEKPKGRFRGFVGNFRRGTLQSAVFPGMIALRQPNTQIIVVIF